MCIMYCLYRKFYTIIIDLVHYTNRSCTYCTAAVVHIHITRRLIIYYTCIHIIFQLPSIIFIRTCIGNNSITERCLRGVCSVWWNQPNADDGNVHRKRGWRGTNKLHVLYTKAVTSICTADHSIISVLYT